MTKKATKKGNAMSLRDFYESAPGQLPLETRLPCKPGELKRGNEPTTGIQSFSNLALDEVPSSGYKGKAGYPQNYGRVSTGYIGAGNGYNQHVRSHQHGAPFAQSAQPYSHSRPAQPYRVRPGYQDVVDQQIDRSYYMQPPPPPPPRKPTSPVAFRQPSPPPRRQPSPPPKRDSAAQAETQTVTATTIQPLSVPYKPPPQAPQAPKETAVQLVLTASPTSPVQPAKESETQANRQDSELQNSAPKNLWAEKMAQNALERMACAKSSLLAGPSPVLPVAAVPPPPPPPASPARASSLVEAGPAQLAFLKTDHPFARPQVPLPPRSVVSPDNRVNGVTAKLHSALVDAPSAARGTTAETHRPKLNLQPRTKPVEPLGSSPAALVQDGARPRINVQPRAKPVSDTTAKKDSGVPKANSIFGEARPREEILKARGVDVAAAEPERLDRISHGSHNTGSSSRPSSRAASVGSGVSEDEAWHTVSNKKPSKLQHSNGVVDILVGEDVFFTPTMPLAFPRTASHQAYDGDGFHGTFGSPSSFGGGATGAHHGDDGPFFRRSLPTRAGGFF